MALCKTYICLKSDEREKNVYHLPFSCNVIFKSVHVFPILKWEGKQTENKFAVPSCPLKCKCVAVAVSLAACVFLPMFSCLFSILNANLGILILLRHTSIYASFLVDQIIIQLLFLFLCIERPISNWKCLYNPMFLENSVK